MTWGSGTGREGGKERGREGGGEGKREGGGKRKEGWGRGERERGREGISFPPSGFLFTSSLGQQIHVSISMYIAEHHKLNRLICLAHTTEAAQLHIHIIMANFKYHKYIQSETWLCTSTGNGKAIYLSFAHTASISQKERNNTKYTHITCIYTHTFLPHRKSLLVQFSWQYSLSVVFVAQLLTPLPVSSAALHGRKWRTCTGERHSELGHGSPRTCSALHGSLSSLGRTLSPQSLYGPHWEKNGAQNYTSVNQ